MKSKAKEYPEIFLSVKSISLQDNAPREPVKAPAYESFRSGVDLATEITPRGKLALRRKWTTQPNGLLLCLLF